MSNEGVSSMTIAASANPSRRPVDPALDASFKYCHDVARQRAKNFYYGLRLTPGHKRAAGYAIYAFMRACDDLVDQPLDEANAQSPSMATATAPGAGATQEAAVRVGLERIEEFRRTMTRVLSMSDDAWASLPRPSAPTSAVADIIASTATDPSAPFWPAFRHTVQTYHLDSQVLHGMLDGQRADLIKHRYDNFNELYDYCYKVASVVGIVCISLWGAGHSPEAQKLAEYRGVALQLTNILRDISEDAQRGRVYLPAEELTRFGINPEQFITAASAGGAPAGFDELMRFQIERARDYYRKSLALEPLLDADCRATCWALMAIYRALLEKIAANPRRVLSQRVRLSKLHKCWIGARATLRHKVGA